MGYFCLSKLSLQAMFRIFILMIAMVPMTTLRAQVALENNYPGSATIVELSLSGYRYYLMDTYSNACKIYHTDHSLWKTIPLSIPAGMYLYDIQLVSETLFNTDSKTELAYIYYSYDTTLYYYTYYMKVVNEEGVEVLSVPGCGYVNLKTAGGTGSKMLCYVYNYSIYPSTVNTLVYSLPGQIPTGIAGPVSPAATERAYPNPSRQIVYIPVTITAKTGRTTVRISGADGKSLREYPVNDGSPYLSVDVSGYPKGMYSYLVLQGSVLLSSGKFIRE